MKQPSTTTVIRVWRKAGGGSAAAGGFSLMELLVVLVVIAGVAAMVLPMLSMAQFTRVQAAEQTVSIGASVARRYAARDIKFEMDLNAAEPGVQHGAYAGTAVLFTPSNELRIIESIQNAYTSNGAALQLLDDGFGSNPRNGYRDLRGRDYIQMPRGSGVVGIVRHGNGDNDIELLAPPFAVRFNEHGYLVAAHEPGWRDRQVVYDSNYDGWYDVNSTRPSGYDPSEYDPHAPGYSPSTFKREGAGNQAINKHMMEFECIETVLGVIVFDKDLLYDLGMDLSANNGFINSDARAWLLNPDNGKALFFNRVTGRVIRND